MFPLVHLALHHKTPQHLDGEALKECQLPARTLYSDNWVRNTIMALKRKILMCHRSNINIRIYFLHKLFNKCEFHCTIQRWGRKATNLSCSDDLPVKQLLFSLLMATSLPLHFPWYTVPNVPEPSSFSCSRSSFFINYHVHKEERIKEMSNGKSIMLAKVG